MVNNRESQERTNNRTAVAYLVRRSDLNNSFYIILPCSLPVRGVGAKGASDF